jgi:phosphatidylinositol alpha-1,6-mannosyltransferase
MSAQVLFITRKWAPAVGGMETYAQKLSGMLAARTKLEIAALPGRKNGRPPSMVALLAFVARAAVRLFRRKVDVVHLGDLVLWPLAFVARQAGSAPIIVITAYGLDLVYGRRPGVVPWIYARYLTLGVRMVGDKIRVIAISTPTAKLCRDAGFGDVTVVTLGVDEPAPLPPPADDVPPPPPFVLFVGRLVKRKGAGWFVCQVLPLLPPALKLVVVGKCWDEQELAKLRESQRVEYHDFVTAETLLELRRQALVVIMPNIPSNGLDVEGFGLTALEAAADGGVLLASGIDGIVDAVVDGRTGFLLPAGDALRWAEKIHEVNSWPPERRIAFIDGARSEIVSRYSWQKVAEKTLEVYRVSP